MPVMELKQVNKSYKVNGGETFQALKDVNLSFEKGELISIIGESGSGKSTLMNLIGGLDSDFQGEILVDGENIRGYSEKSLVQYHKEKVGFVFQSFNLIEELTVFENVELPLIYLNISKSERKERVREVLKRMKIAHRESHFPKQLSGGQQQRVAISRAVITKPKLILADEPTGNLDSKNGIEVMNLLTELNKEGATIVMVTHSDRDSHYAHRVINLFDGQIVSEVKSTPIAVENYL